MKTQSVIFYLLAFALFCSCNEKREKKGLTFNDCPQVAERVSPNGNTLVVCDLAQVKDTFDIPLSALLSSFEVIRLENTDEALTAVDGRVYISDNYLGICSFKTHAYKLYDKKGKYLTTLSSPGQGPDEYFISIYDSYIDERNRKVYLLPFRASKILVFDFDGNALKHIPLPYITHKGRFIVHPEKETLTMLALPFIETPVVVWEQDFNGNVIQEIPIADQFIIEPSTYDNEIWESLNTTNMDYYLHNCIAAQDTLYHYNMNNNCVQPIFTMRTSGDLICHHYTELPNHYMVLWYTQTSWNGEIPRFPRILIDKETLRGCFANLKFDKLGNIDGPSALSFSRGYFSAIMDSYVLKEQLEKALSKPEKLSSEMQQKIKELHNSLTEDDNNIVFIGKLKGGRE